MKKLKSAAALAMVIALLALSACGEKTSPSGEKGDMLKIVCTLFPQYNFAKTIAGDKAEVILLLSPGVESHSYDPAPGDMINIKNSDVFIRIGSGMEVWSDKILTAAGAELNVLNLAEKMKLDIGDSGHEGEHNHEEETDPHIWTSPVFAMQMVRVIEEELCAQDEENSAEYKANAQALINEIESIHKEISETVKSATQKTIVFGSSFALKNFVNEYELEYIAAYDSCGENAEPGAAVMAGIIDRIKNEKIPVVFYEELIEPKAARLIASETGAEAMLFHSCHNVSKDEFNSGETYVSLMKSNLEALKKALGST